MVSKLNKNPLIPRVRLAAPLLCLVVLGAAFAERSRRLSATDVEPYHAVAATAINDIKYTIGFWTGADIAVPEAAQQLLRPNALLSRSYIDNDPSLEAPISAQLLIVQCKDPGDMQGHYPPICYVAHGQSMEHVDKLSFTLTGKGGGEPFTVHGTEYRFSRNVAGQRIGTAIFNTLLIPGVGTTPDMKGVYKAAADYRRALYGAAQIQIVLSDEVPPEKRREIYESFLNASESTMRTFLSASPDQPPSVSQASLLKGVHP